MGNPLNQLPSCSCRSLSLEIRFLLGMEEVGKVLPARSTRRVSSSSRYLWSWPVLRIFAALARLFQLLNWKSSFQGAKSKKKHHFVKRDQNFVGSLRSPRLALLGSGLVHGHPFPWKNPWYFSFFSGSGEGDSASLSFSWGDSVNYFSSSRLK